MPLNMVRRPVNSALPNVVTISHEGREWNRVLTMEPSPMRALPEEALVWAGMSRLWPTEFMEPIFVDLHERKFS